MNNKAFIFTMDAILALIPVFIILAGVSGISYDPMQFVAPPLQKQAQNSIGILLLGDTPLLQQYISDNSTVDKIQSALSNTVTYSFMFMYNSTSTSNWRYVAGRANNSVDGTVVQNSRDAADDLFTAERLVYQNDTKHQFRMYIWVE